MIVNIIIEPTSNQNWYSHLDFRPGDGERIRKPVKTDQSSGVKNDWVYSVVIIHLVRVEQSIRISRFEILATGSQNSYL